MLRVVIVSLNELDRPGLMIILLAAAVVVLGLDEEGSPMAESTDGSVSKFFNSVRSNG